MTVTVSFGVPVAPAPTKWQPPSFAQKLMCMHPSVATHRFMQASADASLVRHFLLPLPQRLQLQKAGSLSIGVYIISISLTAVVYTGLGVTVRKFENSVRGAKRVFARRRRDFFFEYRVVPEQDGSGCRKKMPGARFRAVGWTQAGSWREDAETK